MSIYLIHQIYQIYLCFLCEPTFMVVESCFEEVHEVAVGGDAQVAVQLRVPSRA